MNDEWPPVVNNRTAATKEKIIQTAIYLFIDRKQFI